MSAFSVAEILRLYPKLRRDPQPAPKRPAVDRGIESEAEKAFCQRCHERGYCSIPQASKLLAIYRGAPDFAALIDKLSLKSFAKFEHPSLKFLLDPRNTPEIGRGIAALSAAKHLSGRTAATAWTLMSQDLPLLPLADQVARASTLCATAREFHRHHPDRDFPLSYLAEVQCILEKSKDPAADLLYLHHKNGSPKFLTAERLTEFYAAGNSFIPHLHSFGAVHERSPSNSLNHLSLQAFRERLAKLDDGPLWNSRQELIANFRRIDESLQPYLLDLYDAIQSKKCNPSGFITLLTGLAKGNIDGEAAISMVSMLPHFPRKELLDVALRKLNKLVEHPQNHDSAEVSLAIKGFEALKLQRNAKEGAPAVQSITYTKTLADLRSAFRAPDLNNPDVQIVSDDRLEAALEVYQRIQRRMRGRFEPEKLPREDPVSYFSHALRLHQSVHGFTANETQLLAMILLTDGSRSTSGRDRQWAEIATGEGKSLYTAMLSGFHAIRGEQAHVLTIADEFADRDWRLYRGFLRRMGLTSATCMTENDRDLGAHLKNVNVIFSGPGLLFAHTSAELRRETPLKRQFALIDEGDFLLQDNARTASGISSGLSSVFTAPVMAKLSAFIEHGAPQSEAAWLAHAASEARRSLPELQSTSEHLIAVHLRSILIAPLLRENVDYVVQGNKVQVIDGGNGRLVKSHWMHGLRTIIEQRHGLSSLGEEKNLAEITFLSYISCYAKAIAISGTFGLKGSHRELEHQHGFLGFKVPSHRPSRLVVYPSSLFSDSDTYRSYLVERGESLIRSDRPRAWLHIEDSVEAAKGTARFLKQSGFSVQLLTDVENVNREGQTASEAAIVAEIGKPGAITVATTVAARNTNIPVSPEVLRRGGLHTSVGYIAANMRALRQAQGRSGRQGETGSAETVACAQTDSFIAKLPTTARHAVLSLLEQHGPRSMELHQALEFCQRADELHGAIARKAVLAKDQQIQQLLRAFYYSVDNVVARLTESNEDYRSLGRGTQGGGRVGVTVAKMVSVAMMSPWSSLFEETSQRVQHPRILASSVHQDPSEAESGEAIHHELRDAFARAFRRPTGETAGKPQFGTKAQSDLYQSLANSLLELEIENRPLKNDQFAQELLRVSHDLKRHSEAVFEWLNAMKPEVAWHDIRRSHHNAVRSSRAGRR